MYKLYPLLFFSFGVFGWIIGADSSVIFALFYAAIALAPKALGFYAGKLDPFEPYFGLSLLFFLYGFSTLIFLKENQVSYNMETVSTAAKIEYLIVCLAGQLGLVLGYLVGPHAYWRGVSAIPQKLDVRIRILLGPALICALLLLPLYVDQFNFLNVISYADNALESRVVRMANPEAGIRDVFLRDAPTQIVLFACVLFLTTNLKKSLLLKFISAAILGAYLATNLLAGARGQVVLGVLLLVIFIHYHIRRLNSSMMFIGAVFTYVLVNALSIMRSSSDFEKMIALLFDYINNNGFDFLLLSNSGELATSSNLLTLIIGIQGNQTNHSLGYLFFSQFGALIPRAIWLDRPPMASELFVQTFFPGVFESGGGYGLFFHQEGYWDFGVIGVVVYAAILAWFTRILYVRLIIHNPGYFSTLLYNVFYGVFVLAIVRSGFVGSIKAASIVAWPLLFIIILVRLSRLLKIQVANKL